MDDGKIIEALVVFETETDANTVALKALILSVIVVLGTRDDMRDICGLLSGAIDALGKEDRSERRDSFQISLQNLVDELGSAF